MHIIDHHDTYESFDTPGDAFLDAVGTGNVTVGEVAEWFGCSRSMASNLTRNIQARHNQ